MHLSSYSLEAAGVDTDPHTVRGALWEGAPHHTPLVKELVLQRARVNLKTKMPRGGGTVSAETHVAVKNQELFCLLISWSQKKEKEKRNREANN